ncbi:MAG: peptidyl-prolyl cis-trans isomerase [Nitrospiraceae bacterium]|nr:peptidyl-prolyl cis-trans isomerase [Nitrospiraceae bacterium]
MVSAAIAVLFALGCAGGPKPEQAAASGEDPRKIVVARVNDGQITLARVLKTLKNLPPKSDTSSPETPQELRARALDSSILLELAYQRAVQSGLQADDRRVAIALDNYKQTFGSDEEYAAVLAKQGMTEADMRAEIERSLTISILYKKEVEDVVTVPEEELNRVYEAEKDRLVQPEQVKVTDIYLLKDEGAASEKLMAGIRQKLTSLPDQDPWKLVLDGSFMVRRMTVRQDREPDLYRAAKALQPGKLSSLIQTAKGMHIIRLESLSPERLLTFDEAKPFLTNELKAPFQEKQTKAWEEELKKEARIVITENTLR